MDEIVQGWYTLDGCSLNWTFLFVIYDCRMKTKGMCVSKMNKAAVGAVQRVWCMYSVYCIYKYMPFVIHVWNAITSRNMFV